MKDFLGHHPRSFSFLAPSALDSSAVNPLQWMPTVQQFQLYVEKTGFTCRTVAAQVYPYDSQLYGHWTGEPGSFGGAVQWDDQSSTDTICRTTGTPADPGIQACGCTAALFTCRPCDPLRALLNGRSIFQPFPPWCRQTLKRSITWRHAMAISMQVLNPIVTVSSEAPPLRALQLSVLLLFQLASETAAQP